MSVKWKAKAVVQKAISYLPYSRNMNYFFQKYVTKGVYLDEEYFMDRLEHAQEHLQAYEKYGAGEVPRSTLEIGTGWYPVVPIAFYLQGVSQIYSVDLEMLTNADRIRTTIDAFLELHELGRLSQYLTIDEKRMAVLSELSASDSVDQDAMLAQMNITYLIEDARNLSLDDESIDLINSNNTFEHIYPELLEPILKDFVRVVKKGGGVMSHFIDMSDHFAHFDKGITVYNFLQFSDKAWSRIDNSIQPQSRLRYSDYIKIYQELDIPITETDIREGNQTELETVTLNAKYDKYTAEDMAITHCHIISQM